ncbi:LysR family transcriptional regulator [Actinoplanes regularis]|uniref:DNA-binding transcriptional regulator, LysR family n=1 Tax=Actinoplanes regularis TaxID=52697 RepID=A0A239DT75_9ACTN|nr:LysR family transcriptional regulator [Actinoplanes regularis]GIE89020.1 LysR family transcriptional regulator [Actinoplanes regularis]SNS35547.1 DNA-binding transcriptional regulator, LysR family [Actinoplanes regularis]
MDLRRLHYFVVLAEEESFTKAADRLHITQPALSQQLRVLERELGARLIERGPGRCTLTAVGTVAVAEARELLAQADSAQARIDAAVREQSGRLRLAYTRSARGGMVDAIVSRFREQNPRVELISETAWTAPNVEGLLSGRFDVAFVRPPLYEDRLCCRTIGSEELLLAVPSGHRLARRGRITREEVVDEPAVMWPRENGPGMFDRTVGQVWPNDGFNLVRHEPDDEQLLRAVAEGSVVAAVPAGRARALRLPGVRLRRFTAPVPTVDIGLAYHPRRVSPATQRLISVLDELVPPGASAD